MNYKSKISLLLLFVIVAIACRKDWQKSPEEETSAFLTEAKSYYYEQQRASPPPPTKTLNAQSVASVTGLGKLSPLWHRNYASSTKALQFVEVPLVNSQKRVTLYNFNAKPTSAQINIARVKASFQRVLIYKTKRNRFHQLLLTYVPDYDYLQQKNFNASTNQINKIDAEFSGYILFSSLKTGQNIQLLQFEHGKMVNKRTLSAMGKGFMLSQQKQNTKGGPQTMGWEEQCVDIYETPCITAGDPGVEVCQDPIKVGEECGPVWVDDPVEPEDPEPGGDPCDDPANFWMCNPDDPDPSDDEGEQQQPEDARDSLKKIMKDTCLSATQTETLYNMFESYLSGDGNSSWACLRKKQYDLVSSLGKKFGFCIKDISGAAQAYDPKKDNFYFSTEASLGYGYNFDHEFFHSYQNTFLPGGTVGFAKAENETTGVTTYPDGFVNLEFEVALYLDITRSRIEQGAFVSDTIPNNVKAEYIAWLNTITANNTKYPKTYADLGGQYFYFMGLFKQYSGYSNKGNILNTMLPSTLLNLFSTTNCK